MDNTLKIRNYAENLKNINKKNYITSFLLIALLYNLLQYFFLIFFMKKRNIF